MGATTPTYALPYPVGSDLARDGDNSIKALAERVEALLATRDAADAVRVGRNVIRNGDFRIAQRGNGGFATTGAYALDGVVPVFAGPTVTLARGPLGTSYVPFTHYMTATTSAAATAAGDYDLFELRIEDVRTLAGQQATLSFYAGGTVGRTLGLASLQYFGSGGSPSPTVTSAFGSVVIANATLTRYSVTFTVPDVAGKTLGSAGNDYLCLRFWLGSGSTNLATSGLGAAGAQAGWQLNFTGVQLEAGPVATPFEWLNQQAQLDWCRRYYQRYDATGSAVGHFMPGLATSATVVFIPITFYPPMRATPANPTWSGVGSSDGVIANKTNTSSVVWNPGYVSNQHGLLQVNFPSGCTAHWPEILTLNGAGAYIAWSAEL